MNFFIKKIFDFSNKVYKVYTNKIKSKDIYVKDNFSIDPKKKNWHGYSGVIIIPQFKIIFI